MGGEVAKQSFWRRAVPALFQLRQAPWRWEVGAEAAVAMGVPLALFTIAGRQAEGLIASQGAFTALYCSSLRRIDRVRALPFVGLGFVLSSAVGVLASSGRWLPAVCLIVVSVVATTISLTIGIGPPGPMHFVLVAGISGAMAARATTDRFSIPLWVAVGALGAYVAIIAPLLVPSVRRRSGEGTRLRELYPVVRLTRTTAMIGARIVVAVAIASLISVPLGVNRDYWVVMVAGVVIQGASTTRAGLVRSAQRIAGTFVGVGVFAVVAAIGPSGLWLVLLLALLQGAVEVVIARNYGLGLVFITPLALSIVTAGRGVDTGLVVRDRIVDTLLGALIALALLWGSERVRRTLVD